MDPRSRPTPSSPGTGGGGKSVDNTSVRNRGSRPSVTGGAQGPRLMETASVWATPRVLVEGRDEFVRRTGFGPGRFLRGALCAARSVRGAQLRE